MLLSRRQFNRGTLMLSGAAAMPPVPVSMKRGSDDAFELLISELARNEEAAYAAGLTTPGGGAVSAAGRRLEGFISHLDMKVSPLETSGQVFRELRAFVKDQVREAARDAGKLARQAAEEHIDKDVGEEIPSYGADDTGADATP